MKRYSQIKKEEKTKSIIQKFKEEILSAVTEFDTSRPSDQQILRISIASELSAINLYQELAALTDDPNLKKVILDITKEEKTHISEFETMLLRIDDEQIIENLNGKKEVEDLIGN